MTDITWTNATVKLSQLQPWQDNPKTSTAKNAEQLTTSVDELGQFQDVAIGPFNGNGLAPVYDGHQRLNAWAHAYGLGYEVTAKQSSRPLTEDERRKVAIYSRQIGAWDWEKLANWDVPLVDWGMDADLLSDWGRDYSNLREMLETETDPLDLESFFDDVVREQEEKAGYDKIILEYTVDECKAVRDAFGQLDGTKEQILWGLLGL